MRTVYKYNILKFCSFEYSNDRNFNRTAVAGSSVEGVEKRDFTVSKFYRLKTNQVLFYYSKLRFTVTCLQFKYCYNCFSI